MKYRNLDLLSRYTFSFHSLHQSQVHGLQRVAEAVHHIDEHLDLLHSLLDCRCAVRQGIRVSEVTMRGRMCSQYGVTKPHRASTMLFLSDIYLTSVQR